MTLLLEARCSFRDLFETLLTGFGFCLHGMRMGMPTGSCKRDEKGFIVRAILVRVNFGLSSMAISDTVFAWQEYICYR